jgi:hypothetical protein
MEVTNLSAVKKCNKNCNGVNNMFYCCRMEATFTGVLGQ